MARPTEQAQKWFENAQTIAARAERTLWKTPMTSSSHQSGIYDQAMALGNLAKGLGEIAVGLRATYILLEEVKNLLERQGR
jgi:hypothetical protein